MFANIVVSNRNYKKKIDKASAVLAAGVFTFYFSRVSRNFRQRKINMILSKNSKRRGIIYVKINHIRLKDNRKIKRQ